MMYVDKPTKKDLRQPKLEKLKVDTLEGKVRTVVVWHFDRLALAAREGLRVLVDWCEESLRIVSVSQQIDIKSADCNLAIDKNRQTLALVILGYFRDLLRTCSWSPSSSDLSCGNGSHNWR